MPYPKMPTDQAPTAADRTICLQIEGMHCTGCANRIRQAIQDLPGVVETHVDLLTRRAYVRVSPEEGPSPEALSRAVSLAGYSAKVLPGPQTTLLQEFLEESKAERQFWLLRFAVAVGALVPVLLLGFVPEVVGHFSLLLQFLIGSPAIFYSAWPYFRGAWRRLLARSADMDSLISLGTGAAAVGGILQVFYPSLLGHSGALVEWLGAHHSYFGEALLILSFVSLGKYLEASARSRAGNAIVSLLSLAPKSVPLVRGETIEEVPVEKVLPGQEILIRPGTTVPLDGQVLSGTTAIDQSWLTGEAMPVEVGPGDIVYAGTHNVGSGALRVSVLRDADSTTLAQIIRLAQEAQRQKPRLARTADKLVEALVPVVLLVAATSFIIWAFLANLSTGLATFIAVLVVACPCAIGIATPMAVMVGIGRGTQLGILFKSGEAIETAAKITAVVLDKTGTVTLGKPRVTEVVPAPGISEEQLLQVAAAAERLSGHPFAEAIVSAAEDRGISVPLVDDLEVLPGKGIRATLEGRAILVGNERLFAGTYIDLDPQRELVRQLRRQGKTPLWIAYDGRRLGVIALSDPIGPGSKEAVEELKKLGLRVCLVSGDHQLAVAAIANELGIDEVRAEVFPDQKVQIVQELQAAGHVVAMIGDGINDAPAMMAANVGIAIGSAADIAIEAAGVVLLRQNLLSAVYALRLARVTLRTIRENLFWALIYNLCLIPLAAGILRPWWGIIVPPALAAAAMAASDVCVVGNSLRLRWRKS